jgi:hypothetical protein
MADQLSWWELYKQELGDEFKRLAKFGQQAANAAVNTDQHWQNLLAIWNKAKSDWDAFVKGRDLDKVRVAGAKLSSVVVILRDAEDILEDFRLNRLKETIQDRYQAIRDAIEQMKTGPADFAEQAGSTDDVGPVTRLMVRIDDFLTQVENILNAILQIVELFDVVTNTEKELEKKALAQKSARTKTTDTYFKRSA